MKIFIAEFLILIYALFLSYLLFKKRFKTVIFTILSALLAKFIKLTAGRLWYIPRPFVLNDSLPYYRQVTEGFFSKFFKEGVLYRDSSFFSSHAAISFAIAASIYFFYNKRIGIVFLIIAGIISWGRVLVNVHYFIDVEVGALVGLASALLVYKIVDY